MASPKLSSDALQASVRVLADPMLWRCISTFQRGLPMPLYAFWVAQDPTATLSSNRNVVSDNIDGLIKRVVHHGTPQLLTLLPLVRYYCYGQSMTPSLQLVAQHAIEASRVDMIEWAMANHVVEAEPVALWRLALKHYADSDVRVLEVLHQYKPIQEEEMRGLTSSLAQPSLVRWIVALYPGALDPAIMANAVCENNFTMVQYLHENFPAVKFGHQPYEIAHEEGYVQLLVYLLEKRPHSVSLKLLRRLVEDDDSEIHSALTGVPAFYKPARKLATRFIAEDDWEYLDRLLDFGWFDGGEPFLIDQAAARGYLDFIEFLMERKLVVVTTDAMDLAAEEGQWDVVFYLHEHNVGGCTTRVMDAAAAQGDIEHVKFFHKNRSEGCTTRAMDGAAENDWLNVVLFLHKNRSEGCTTDAMDKAAKRGNLRVVEFLHKSRTEGCTKAAVIQAIDHGHVAVVRFFYKHYPSYFGPELLHNLLLRGVFDVWMELRAIYPDEDDTVVERVLFEAGKHQELATIQFIIHELGRDDIAHLAVDGAATNACGGSVEWLRAVLTVAGPQSCRLSAIRHAVASEESVHTSYRVYHLKYLITVCSESGARELVISMGNDSNNHVVGEIERWDPEKEPLELQPLHPILADSKTPGWAVRSYLRSTPVLDPHGRFVRYVPWAAQAIYHYDHEMLKRLVERGESIAESYDRGYSTEFSFEGVRATAARVGSLDDLQFLLKNLDLPIEPILLDEALYYDQLEVAEWLLEHCREGCQALNWASSPQVLFESDIVVLEWIDSHPAMRELIDFGAMAYQAVEYGNLVALDQLFSRYPEVFTTRTDLAKPAVEKGHQEVLDFLAKIQYAYLPPSSAVQVEDSTSAL